MILRMKFPVVIAAHNEQEVIGRTLDRLDATLFEPIVIANGCTDETAIIAKEYGACVIERQEQGKLPAIQEGLRHLGSRALAPVFFTDADSYPLSNKGWHRSMLDKVDEAHAQVISGPIVHIDGANFASDAVRTAKRQLDIRRAKRQGLTHCFGANILSHLKDETVLEEVLGLPHIWPGEDRAIEELVTRSGGEKVQVTDLRASIMTSSRYLPPVGHVLRVGKDQARQEILDFYSERAAEGSITFGQYAKRRRRLAKRKTRV